MTPAKHKRSPLLAPGVTQTQTSLGGFSVNGQRERNQFYGPAFNKVDFSVIKRFPITENTRFTIRADFFNIFNTVNFGLPGNDINSALFGQSTTAGAPRIIQFAGRFDF